MNIAQQLILSMHYIYLEVRGSISPPHTLSKKKNTMYFYIKIKGASYLFIFFNTLEILFYYLMWLRQRWLELQTPILDLNRRS